MTKGGMANVMSQGYRLDEVFIKPQKTPDGPGYLGNQLYVKNPVGDVIVLHKVKHLCLVYVSGIGEGVKYSVCVQRKVLPVARSDMVFNLAPCCAVAETGPL